MAIWFPRLPTDRLRRKMPKGALADRGLVLAVKAENALRIYACDDKATRQGLRVGQALADARAMVPDIEVVEADAAADEKLLAQIADWCDRFTPYVALDLPDGLFLDITGCAHLFGGERGMMETVQKAITKQGFNVRTALAGTSPSAFALAHYAHGTIAEAGCEVAVLSGLPVECLKTGDKSIHALRRAGLKTVGQVALRARSELAARFGKEFVYRLEQALGQNEAPISPRRPLPDFMAERRFAEPLTAEPVIMATLHELAQSLACVLEERGQGARVMEALFFRADGTMRFLKIEIGTPTRDPKVIERLFRTKLDALPDPLDPGFGFDLIRLEATVAERAQVDAIGFGSDAKAEKEIAQLIDRLSARFGAHRVIRFQANDTHIPEAASAPLPAQGSMRTGISWEQKRGYHEMPRRPLRLFAPPEPIEVVAEVPDGPPARFRWRTVSHVARNAAGPESISMEWWRHHSMKPTRDYFRVEDAEGRRYWIFREGDYRTDIEPRWFMHGVFA